MSKPVAIVTGAASGIGLAVTKHLLTKGYRVVMADVNGQTGAQISSELGPDTLFIRTDVSKYADQATLFSRAFEWGGNRLDFFHGNAGIDDRQSLYQKDEPLGPDRVPLPLNLKTIEIDLNAVIQGLWLFKHYARRNTPNHGGKAVVTSSAAGLYNMTTNPLYGAAKAGLVGLVRSAGPVFVKENITLNAICPAFVPTNLCPPGMIEKFPKEHITPMTTVLKAIDTFLANDAMSGETVELSLDNLYFRKQPEWANESQKWLGEDSEGFWEEAYKEVAKPRANGV